MSQLRKRWLAVAGAAIVAATIGLTVPAFAGLTTGTVSGHLTDGGAPVAAIPVTLTDASYTTTISGTTDSTGSYSLVDVPAGDYQLSFTLPGWVIQYVPQTFDVNLAGVVTVAADAITTVDESVAPHGSLTGHVTSSDGSALPYPYVLASSNQVYAQLSGDANGDYVMPYLPAGTYVVSFQDGHGPEQFAHQKTRRALADPIIVTAGAATTLDETFLPLGTVTGHLTDSAGNPVPGAGVQFLSPALDVPVSGYTDADGAYQATVFAGAYQIEFDTPNGPQWAHGRTSAATADPITVTGGATIIVDDSLLPPGTVTITARNSVTGQPVAAFCAGLAGVWNFPCTQDGTVTAPIQPGGYDLSIYPDSPDYLVKHVGTVQVASGQTTTIVVDVPPSATLTTTVRDAKTDAPVEGVCLDLIQPLRPTGLGTGGDANCSDATGRVTVPQITANTYTVFAWTNDGVHGDQWVGPHGGVGAQAKARLVTLATGAAVTMPDIKLDLRGTVTGLVLDAKTHLPMPYTIAGWSTANSGFGGSKAQAYADSTGRYTFDNLGPYEWTLYFQAMGYASEFSGHTANRFDAEGVKVKAGQTTTYDVGLSKGVTLTGIVSHSDGQPVSSVRITVVPADSGDEIGVNDTGSDGRYTIQVLGDQRIKLKIEAYADGSGLYWYVSAVDFATATTLRIPSKGTKTVNITLTHPTL